MITLRGRVQLEIRKIGYVYSGMKREIRIFYFDNGIDLMAINSISAFQLNKVKTFSDDEIFKEDPNQQINFIDVFNSCI